MKKLIGILLSLCLLVGMSKNVFANEFLQEMSADRFLLNTGMTQEEIDDMDQDIKKYIVENLQENAKGDIEYIAVSDCSNIQSRSAQILNGISFSVQAWEAGGVIHIYPTYEFTTPKRPRGKDAFGFCIGDKFVPYEYGGKLWCKDADGETWISDASDKMTANIQFVNGAIYTGNQLGNASFNIYLKGCTYIKATAGTGSYNTIAMNYMYNPNGNSYSYSVSAYGVGLSFTSSQTIYTNGATVAINY